MQLKLQLNCLWKIFWWNMHKVLCKHWWSIQGGPEVIRFPFQRRGICSVWSFRKIGSQMPRKERSPGKKNSTWGILPKAWREEYVLAQGWRKVTISLALWILSWATWRDQWRIKSRGRTWSCLHFKTIFAIDWKMSYSSQFLKDYSATLNKCY